MPVSLGSVGEQRLARQAGGNGIGVHLGIAFPGTDHLQLEHAPFDVRRDDRMIDGFGSGQRRGVDLMQAPAES